MREKISTFWTLFPTNVRLWQFPVNRILKNLSGVSFSRIVNWSMHDYSLLNRKRSLISSIWNQDICTIMIHIAVSINKKLLLLLRNGLLLDLILCRVLDLSFCSNGNIWICLIISYLLVFQTKISFSFSFWFLF